MGISVDKKFKDGTLARSIRDLLIAEYPVSMSRREIAEKLGIPFTVGKLGNISATLHNGFRLQWDAWERNGSQFRAKLHY